MAIRVLIIDDEVQLGRMVKINLESTKEFLVDTAIRGAEGIDMLTSNNYDILLIDVIMPDMSGLQAVEKIRALETSARDIPIIMISAKSSMEEITRHLDIYAFISKPFTMEELVAKIQSALCDAKEVRESQQESVHKIGNDEKIVLVGVEDYILTKLKTYLEARGFSVVKAFNEDDAIEKTAALRPKFILAQYWEESDKFDALKIYRATQEDTSTRASPCVTFCSESLGIQASKDVPKDTLLTFNTSIDLLGKLGRFLMRQA